MAKKSRGKKTFWYSWNIMSVEIAFVVSMPSTRLSWTEGARKLSDGLVSRKWCRREKAYPWNSPAFAVSKGRTEESAEADSADVGLSKPATQRCRGSEATAARRRDCRQRNPGQLTRQNPHRPRGPPIGSGGRAEKGVGSFRVQPDGCSLHAGLWSGRRP